MLDPGHHQCKVSLDQRRACPGNRGLLAQTRVGQDKHRRFGPPWRLRPSFESNSLRSRAVELHEDNAHNRLRHFLRSRMRRKQGIAMEAVQVGPGNYTQREPRGSTSQPFLEGPSRRTRKQRRCRAREEHRERNCQQRKGKTGQSSSTCGRSGSSVSDGNASTKIPNRKGL
jgi:hypothetical protein